jgi:hypothetical protein
MTDSRSSMKAFADVFRNSKGTTDFGKVLAGANFPVYCLQHPAFSLRSPGYTCRLEENAHWRIDAVTFTYVSPDIDHVEKFIVIGNFLGAHGSPSSYRKALKTVVEICERAQRESATPPAVFPDNLGPFSEYWYHGELGPATVAMQYLKDMPWRQLETPGLSFNWLGWNEPTPFVLAQHHTDQTTLVVGAIGVLGNVMRDLLASLVRVDNNPELAAKLQADLEAVREAFRH